MSILQKLKNSNIFKSEHPFITDDICYEVIMGSFAYGVSNNTSDIDIYAVCVPPKEMTFPHLNGHIDGFGKKPQSFTTTQQHHMQFGEKEYDASVYSLVRYFAGCADNNPNMIDSLFVPDRCITSINNIGKIMRENKKLFLHKGAYHRFKGYAYKQLSKMRTKVPTGKRKDLVDKFGYDTKFAYHIVRLALECEQILHEGDLNLEQSKEILKSVRKGEWSMDKIESFFEQKVIILDELNIKSDLRKYPDFVKLKEILLYCLEEQYGSLSNAIDNSESSRALSILQQIKQLIK